MGGDDVVVAVVDAAGTAFEAFVVSVVSSGLVMSHLLTRLDDPPEESSV